MEVSSNAYRMSDQKFFYASYAINGETVNKKLSNDVVNLKIDAHEFFSVDGKKIDHSSVSDIELFYYDSVS